MALGTGTATLLGFGALGALISASSDAAPGALAGIWQALLLSFSLVVVYVIPDDVVDLLHGRVVFRQPHYWWRSLPNSPTSPAAETPWLDPSKPCIALTIDDVPCYRKRFGASDVAQSVEVLRRFGARATLFVMSDEIEQHSDPPRVRAALADAVAAGCELGNHSTVDEKSALRSVEQLRTQIRRCGAEVARYDPKGERWYRPGGGFYTGQLLRVAAEEGYRVALGNIYPHDALISSAAHSAWYTKWRAREGGIIILHDRPGALCATLEMVLPSLCDRFNVVTLSDMFPPLRRR